VAEIPCDMNTAHAAVLGGCLLGGGGGGSMEQGLALARLSVEAGQPRIVSIDSIEDNDILVTVGLVGSPASHGACVKPAHYLRTVEMIMNDMRCSIAGIISNENGAVGTVNGWFQSAMTGIPVVDAPCNGRAHPTGQMGSMCLDKLPDYQSMQAFAGGGGHSPYMEGLVRGRLDATAGLVRNASVIAGGLVAVARNPVDSRYARENGAPGAIHQAIEVGKLITEKMELGGAEVAEAVAEYMRGRVLFAGRVRDIQLTTSGGFDVGEVFIENMGTRVKLTFWNEYMTAARSTHNEGWQRAATFPDLIATLDCKSGLPLTTAEIQEDDEVCVIIVPKLELKLGSTMWRRDLISQIESVIGESIMAYAFNQNAVT